ncbi:MAG: ABC transporter permease [Deltaproteobacteria bacterium]|nr:ABC transporter permease [Deltaproteobacteria bacterium]MBF0527517.1 ABC transporter permease [Deltaproteobacteria bacterium]
MNLSLLLEFTKRDLVEKYSGSALGVLWTFIWPLFTIFIYVVVFSNIMGSKLPGSSSSMSYSTYLVAGILPWTAFANTVSRSATVFSDRKAIISKIKISLPYLPLYIVLSESAVFVISILIYIGFLLGFSSPISVWIIFVPWIYLTHQIFAYALGFLIAIFQVFIRDLREVTGIVLQIWFWFTPIVYTINILPKTTSKWFDYNPAFIFIKAYHDIFVFDKMPNFFNLMIITVIGHGLLIISYLFYRKLEKGIRDVI